LRYLVTRYGAIGDSILITPLLRYLKEKGNEVYLHTSETGLKILAENPFVDKIVPYKSNSIPPEKLDEFWEGLRKAYECDKHINLCESIEVSLALHPSTPQYNLPKKERMRLYNKNYYDYCFEFSKNQCSEIEEIKGKRGELFFTKEEEMSMQKIIEEFKKERGVKKILMWALTGSGRNKTYPYFIQVVGELLKLYPEWAILTVGDNVCQMFEYPFEEEQRVIRRSGKWEIRQSLLATKYVDLVVAPDTGILHGAGCFDTPKIGLFGHSTKENVTKYFKNDFSLESEGVSCSPCLRLIYEANVQCAIDPLTTACLCMSDGLKADRVLNHIKKVINDNIK